MGGPAAHIEDAKPTGGIMGVRPSRRKHHLFKKFSAQFRFRAGGQFAGVVAGA
jgi:hypothetical protein